MKTQLHVKEESFILKGKGLIFTIKFLDNKKIKGYSGIGVVFFLPRTNLLSKLRTPFSLRLVYN